MSTMPDEVTQLLREAEDDRAFARIVPGIAHDAGSLLGVALTAASHAADTLAGLREAFEDGTLTRSRTAADLDRLDQAARLTVSNLRRAAGLLSCLKQLSADLEGEDVEAVDVPALLLELAESLAPMAKRSAVRIEVASPGPLVVRTVPSPLARALLNLVQNALVHAFPGDAPGTVVLSAEPDGDGALLVVKDDGRGMSPAEEARAFEAYFTTRGGQGGTGLGLALVRELVEGPLRGSVTLKTAPGRGSTFRLHVPGLAGGKEEAR